MGDFRFGIMGAGKIAHKFCEAVRMLENCKVTAVSSKSLDRAKTLAEEEKIEAFYDSYEKMLIEEKPDCVYIAVTPNAHYELCMLCLKHKTPILCEKAMFLNSREAKEVFTKAEELGVFVMEAMWSRFLPAVEKGKKWLEEGRIGKPIYAEAAIGFMAEADPENRFNNKSLGGGAAYDVTVYVYELMDFFLGKEESASVSILKGPTGVDKIDHVVLQYGDMMAGLTASIGCKLEQKLIIYGEKGRIYLPNPHHTTEAYILDDRGMEVEVHFDDSVKNGFIFEIMEVMNCIREGKIESTVVPHSLTIRCAEVFDLIGSL